jgi:hypothetical protein
MLEELVTIHKAATGARTALVGQLKQSFQDAEAQITHFIKSVDEIGSYDHYKVFPPAAHTLADRILVSHGIAVLRRFLRAVLSSAVLMTIDSGRFKALPPRTAANQRKHLLRIAKDSADGDEWLDLGNDLFQKEFGLATLRLYAAGAQLIDFRCGVPRSNVLKGGLRKALTQLLRMTRFGGFRPYFQIHTHTFNLDAFNEAGWEECYLCCAELYNIHPNVLGMFGSSWFYDPALATISPRLAYLRDTPCNNGAILMLVVKGGDAINLSISTSPSRRKLYEDGKYVPTSFMLVWSRKAQIEWAARQLTDYAG